MDKEKGFSLIHRKEKHGLIIVTQTEERIRKMPRAVSYMANLNKRRDNEKAIRRFVSLLCVESPSLIWRARCIHSSVSESCASAIQYEIAIIGRIVEKQCAARCVCAPSAHVTLVQCLYVIVCRIIRTLIFLMPSQMIDSVATIFNQSPWRIFFSFLLF